MLGLWLTCWKHKDNPGWKSTTNAWLPWDIWWAWRYGYRRLWIGRSSEKYNQV